MQNTHKKGNLHSKSCSLHSKKGNLLTKSCKKKFKKVTYIFSKNFENFLRSFRNFSVFFFYFFEIEKLHCFRTFSNFFWKIFKTTLSSLTDINLVLWGSLVEDVVLLVPNRSPGFYCFFHNFFSYKPGLLLGRGHY